MSIYASLKEMLLCTPGVVHLFSFVRELHVIYKKILRGKYYTLVH